MYPSKLAIQLSVQYVQPNLLIIILPVGVPKPFGLQSVDGLLYCEKLDVVHPVYDQEGGSSVGILQR